MLRLRIFERGHSSPQLERQLRPAVIMDSLEAIKTHLSTLERSHFTVVADDGEIYKILWRSPR